MKALIAVLALTVSVSSFARTPIKTYEGSARTWNADATSVGLYIQGEAAKLIFEKLTSSKEATNRNGSLIVTTRLGRDLKCTRQAAFAVNYSCELKVDETGAVGF